MRLNFCHAGVIWLQSGNQINNDLKTFIGAILPKIRRMFVLVTTWGDNEYPRFMEQNSIITLLKNPFLVAWYTQNYDFF